MRTSTPVDLLERLAVDPGKRTLGELLQEREWARVEILALRRELSKVPAARVERALEKVAARKAPATPPLDRPAQVATSAPDAASAARLLRLNDVADLVGVGRSTIYAWMRSGSFPKQVRLGQRAAAWRLADVLEWQAKLGS